MARLARLQPRSEDPHSRIFGREHGISRQDDFAPLTDRLWFCDPLWVSDEYIIPKALIDGKHVLADLMPTASMAPVIIRLAPPEGNNDRRPRFRSAAFRLAGL
jgi:hypothetical protein